MKQGGLSRLVHHELTVWCTAVFTAITGHCAASTLLEALERHARWSEFFAWAVVFVAMTTVFYLAYATPLRSRLPLRSRGIVMAKGFIPWMLTGVAVLLLYGIATAVHRWVAGHHFSNGLFGAYSTAFLLCGIVLYVWRNSVLTVHSRYVEQQESSGGKRGHLVLMLSDVDDPSPTQVVWSDPPALDEDLKAIHEAKTKGLDKWSWEMPLHAIHQHVPVVREITLVCSPRSLLQAAAFCERVHTYGGLDVRVWCVRDGVLARIDPRERELTGCEGFDFAEKLDDVSAALTDLLNDMHFVRGVPPRDIMVDFTGGQKPVSFVAAAATLRGELLAQYIDTNTLKPIVYDLVSNAEARVGG